MYADSSAGDSLATYHCLISPRNYRKTLRIRTLQILALQESAIDSESLSDVPDPNVACERVEHRIQFHNFLKANVLKWFIELLLRLSPRASNREQFAVA